MKTTENYERLSRQAWPNIEPGPSRLLVQVQNHSAIGEACQFWAQNRFAAGEAQKSCEIWLNYMKEECILAREVSQKLVIEKRDRASKS